MTTITLNEGQLVISPVLIQSLAQCDATVLPEYEMVSTDLLNHFCTIGTVNLEDIDVTQLIYKLYELFAGAFIAGAMRRGLNEADRAAQLSMYVHRMMINVFYNRQRDLLCVVYDLAVHPIFADSADHAMTFMNFKYLHELSMNSIH